MVIICSRWEKYGSGVWEQSRYNPINSYRGTHKTVEKEDKAPNVYLMLIKIK